MKRFVIAIVAVVIVCALWMGGWFYVSGIVRDEIASLADNDGYSAPRLECDSLWVGGMPFSFSPHCTGVTVHAGDYVVTLADIRGTALFYRPNHIQLFGYGPAEISDTFNGGVWRLDWASLHGSLRLDGGNIARASLVGTEMTLSDGLPGGGEIGTALQSEIHLVASGTPRETGVQTLDLYALLDGVESPAHAIAAGRVTVDGALENLPDAALWSHPDVLRIWAMSGARVTLRGAEAVAEGLVATAEGEVALDESGRVSGEVDLMARGLVERLGTLASDPMAQVLLGTPETDGTYRRTVKITDGTVVVGILPVAVLPPLF